MLSVTCVMKRSSWPQQHLLLIEIQSRLRIGVSYLSIISITDRILFAIGRICVYRVQWVILVPIWICYMLLSAPKIYGSFVHDTYTYMRWRIRYTQQRAITNKIRNGSTLTSTYKKTCTQLVRLYVDEYQLLL